MNDPRPADLLRLPQVRTRTGLSRSSIYDAMARGHFPRAIKLTERTVAWLSSDIDRWIADRIRAAHAARSA